jgi:phosphopantothenoylcysteine decarboxylase/phosphopantothenate--cysteine ligase
MAGVVDLRLEPTLDISRATLPGRMPGALALGFALETEDLRENAARKLREKGFHLIAANAALEEGAGFEVDTNKVTILDREGGVEELPVLPKEAVAERLLDRLTKLLPDTV